MKTLGDVFEHTLHDIYYAENALTKAHPTVMEAASDAGLKKGIEEHLAETKQQITMLDKIFKTMGKKPAAEKCDAIEGLIKETDSVIKAAKTDKARDIAIIACCQAVEHYEIARYGTLKEWAKVLDLTEVHDGLSQILDQEKAANGKLTNLAVSHMNKK